MAIHVFSWNVENVNRTGLVQQRFSLCVLVECGNILQLPRCDRCVFLNHSSKYKICTSDESSLH